MARAVPAEQDRGNESPQEGPRLAVRESVPVGVTEPLEALYDTPPRSAATYRTREGSTAGSMVRHPLTPREHHPARTEALGVVDANLSKVRVTGLAEPRTPPWR